MMNKHGGDIYGYPGVVDFSANINYLGMPQAVKAAAMRGVEESVHYPQAAHRQLRYAVAKRYHIEEDQILCGNAGWYLSPILKRYAGCVRKREPFW